MVRLEFAESGEYYTIVTSGTVRKNYYDKKTPLWEGANLNHSTSGTPDAISGQNGALNQQALSSEINLSFENSTVNPTPRASFLPVAEAKGLIRFFQSADISSAVHEVGHSLRRVLELGTRMDGAPDFVRKDWAAACDFVGAPPGEAWTVPQEELFADAFMDYVHKGASPTPGLRSAFTRLARWLTDLYRRLRGRGVTCSPQMQKVFDNLLATQKELKAARRRTGLEAALTGYEDVPAELLGGEEASAEHAIKQAQTLGFEVLALAFRTPWARSCPPPAARSATCRHWHRPCSICCKRPCWGAIGVWGQATNGLAEGALTKVPQHFRHLSPPENH